MDDSTTAPEGFAIDGVLEIRAEEGGQLAAVVTAPHCTGKVFLHGATVTDFQPTGEDPILFTSSEAIFDGESPIRGGVPVCFPWFNAHPSDPEMPNHGLVRTALWKLAATGYEESSGAVILVFETEAAGYLLSYRVTFCTDLEIALSITNDAEERQEFELALHTYYAVGDIKEVAVDGLKGTTFLDHLKGNERDDLDDELIRFSEEYDRVFVDAPDEIVLIDEARDRRIRIVKTGAGSAVVWNPWIDKAARLGDLGDDEWRKFCCIESGCIADDGILLEPGESHLVSVRIGTESQDTRNR